MKTRAIGWATLAVALLAFRPAGAEAPLAAFEVKGTKPLALGTFGAKTILSPNRDYYFADAPKCLLGLQFTAHLHKGPAAISGTVVASGAAYVCAEASLTLSSLGLDPATWRHVGTMNAIAVGKKFPFHIYEGKLQGDQAISLPTRDRWGVILAAKEIKGLAKFVPVAAKPSVPAKPLDEFSELKRQIAERPQWNNDRLTKEALRPEALLFPCDATPVDVVWRRTNALLDHLQRLPNAPKLETEAADLATLRKQVAAARSAAEPQQREVFDQIAKIRRRVAFKNPLLDFDRILFLKHNRQARGSVHMVDQYLGFNQTKGGGVFVLEQPFSDKPAARSLLAKTPVESGRLKGRTLDDQGSFISLDLDYDGRSILFAFTEAEFGVPEGATFADQYCSREELPGTKHTHYYWRSSSTFHVFRANSDGTGLAQLSDGPFNDYDPCFLPNGRVAFVSERNCGQVRCGARPLPCAVLHAMMPDGSDKVRLSWHDTSEWHPSVDNDGRLVYTRWDYVDRDSDIAHHIWLCGPDGRDPRAPHGNYPESRESRPWMEMSLRAVPGSHRYAAITAPHHGEAYGSIVLIDVRQQDDRASGQIKRVTPEVHFCESESAPGVPHKKGRHTPRAEVYGTPWPLSEDFYLCVYDAGQRNYGLYLLDSFGNRELLYRDPAIACLDPIPFKPRPRPPIIPTGTIQAEADRSPDTQPAELATATVAVMNAYESDQPWPPDTKIKSLRVVTIFPKDTHLQDAPNMGVAAQSLGRGVLGTVPVEEDGSAHFRMPTGAAVYFQLLDENGLAVQTMRSDTYAHPGEKLTCIGCHENKSASASPYIKRQPLALRRAPSTLQPGVAGSFPLTFPRLVQPVLDAKCVGCHDENKKKAPSLHGDRFVKLGWSEAFANLRKYGWGMSGGNGVALRERQYSIPGQVGARASKLYPMLAKGHHGVKLTPEEMHRIVLWLDCNSNFYAAYHDTAKQARGEIIPPKWGLPVWMDFAALVR
ncbi:MAG: hypothetical protein HZC54_01095 [Verrucomicrobia bacterium]|nr:hypothetical protein [Verrucomicrobiota bacterium]